MSPVEKAALERLITIAQAGTGQGRRVADFLLAWWNSAECGAFDLTNLWGLDDAITSDVIIVFAYIAHAKTYPDTLGYSDSFAEIVKEWRPELKAA